MIRANRRITIDEVAEELGIMSGSKHHRHSSIQKSVSTMGAPTIDLDTPEEQHMAVSLEHLVRYHEDV
ncbi:hypothetical protein TNIN_194391 [Trichonephila inaurata madagascariensis]|uniref:Uncharacterized protein n=1 Tax=Trichonephila inaurata madagascariensis TaxID=2747483 RepID=A0A8X6YGL1_9ARAC|nr:hypothetical protein TNIN_194391 [Trichonephila inaurata madagascariensis]